MADFTEQQLEDIASRAARQASKESLEELLKNLGVDTSDFLEVQKDFAHLRQQRKASEQVGTWTRRILLGIFITTACGVFVAGIKSGLKGLV